MQAKMIILKAYAKINLCLYVLGKREDNFHNIFTIMQTIDLADMLYLRKSENFSIKVKNLEITDENILQKAYKKICDYIGDKLPVDITLIKNIPIGTGLGGGSSDAAAFLRGVNELYQLGLENEQLIEIGSEIGSDVPFFFTDGSAIAEGRGEIVNPIELPLSYFVFLVVPYFRISTIKAYSNVRNYLTLPEKLKNFKDYNLKKYFWNILPSFKNSFNEIILKEHPELETEFEQLRNFGADLVSITGSGSAFFGIFREIKDAKRALEYDWNGETFVLSPIRNSISTMNFD